MASTAPPQFVASAPVMADVPDTVKGGTLSIGCVETGIITGVSSIGSVDDRTARSLDVLANNAAGSAVRLGVWDGKAVQSKVLVSNNSVDIKVPVNAPTLTVTDALTTKALAATTASVSGALNVGSLSLSAAFTATGGLVLPTGVGIYFGTPGTSGSWYMGPAASQFTIAECVGSTYVPRLRVKPGNAPASGGGGGGGGSGGGGGN